MKDVQCYELFGGIALKNHAFSFFFHNRKTSFFSLLLSFITMSEHVELICQIVMVSLSLCVYIYIYSKAIVINYMPTLNQRSC